MKFQLTNEGKTKRRTLSRESKFQFFSNFSCFLAPNPYINLFSDITSEHFFFRHTKCKQEEATQLDGRREYMKNDSTDYTHRGTSRQSREKRDEWEEMQDDFKKIFAVKLKVTRF